MCITMKFRYFKIKIHLSLNLCFIGIQYLSIGLKRFSILDYSTVIWLNAWSNPSIRRMWAVLQVYSSFNQRPSQSVKRRILLWGKFVTGHFLMWASRDHHVTTQKNYAFVTTAPHLTILRKLNVSDPYVPNLTHYFFKIFLDCSYEKLKIMLKIYMDCIEVSYFTLY